MTFTKCLMPGTLVAQEAKVTELMSKDLSLPGKEGLMITIEYRRAIRIQCIATMHMVLFMCWRAQS